MPGNVSRRGFIHGVMAATTVCCSGYLSACVREDWLEVFPQGLASGDPGSDSVMLWTRVQSPDTKPLSVEYEVALDERFTEVIASGSVIAEPDWDYTVRLRVEGLSPYTFYYYRFVARGSVSATGRTKTAPAQSQDVPVRFAVASCQDFVGRWYQSWRQLLEEPDVDFVLFLGDYIYETIADPRHQMPQENRRLTLPDGAALSGAEGDFKAVTLADYRSLYKQYKTDPDLLEVHRRFPFVCIWDDHEFANDCWQDHATDTNELYGTEQETARREAATRAWFEFTPIDVPYQEENSFPHDIQIYRALRYGLHVDLVLTDLRYYRQDHLIPEGPLETGVGKFLENSPLGSRIFAQKERFDEREAQVQPTMLGQIQKEWLIDTLTQSDATWKIWGSALMVGQMALDLREVEGMPALFANHYYFKVDHWDGFRSERQEILERLAETHNFLIVSGDLHGFYASRVAIQPDANPEDPAGAVVATEFTTSAISSIPLLDQLRSFTQQDPLLSSMELSPFVERLDELLLDSNPHFSHADSAHNGVMIVDVDAHETAVCMVKLGDVTHPGTGSLLAPARFRVQAGSTDLRVVAE